MKKLNYVQLTELCSEIRDKIIDGAYCNGGHLSSNLGVVELTVALHYVYDIPADKLIFDVGHQCYAHKLLTGRFDAFETIRKEGGLSGFPNTSESEADAFSTGHAGTAIAAGQGFCRARDRLGEDYNVIAVVGDGSFVNGLSTEALMSDSEKPNKFLVVLNDNGMSISKNNNGMYKIISKATTKSRYEKFKCGVKKVFGNSFITKWLISVRDFFKRALNHNAFLDNLGFKYVGVIDGHDIKELIKTLNIVKNSKKPVLLHVKTVKGKGFKDAEEKSDKYHGIGRHFAQSENVFSTALGCELNRLAEKDEKIFAITAAMTDGTGLMPFAEKHPEAFADVGICEEYAVTLAAGMAAAGIKPVVCIYSTFMQRSYDEILHDVCLQNLGVTFCLDRAGVVGADGQTHQGVYDLSYLRTMPHMTVFAPKDVKEFGIMLECAVGLGTPVALRYPNGKDFVLPQTNITDPFKWEVLKDGSDVVLLAVGGRMICAALSAAEAAERQGISAKVVNARCIKPIDGELLGSIDMPIITIEDNCLSGGFGSAVLEYCAAAGLRVKTRCLGIGDTPVSHASVARQLECCGLDADGILTAVKEIL